MNTNVFCTFKCFSFLHLCVCDQIWAPHTQPKTLENDEELEA